MHTCTRLPDTVHPGLPPGTLPPYDDQRDASQRCRSKNTEDVKGKASRPSKRHTLSRVTVTDTLTDETPHVSWTVCCGGGSLTPHPNLLLPPKWTSTRRDMHDSVPHTHIHAHTPNTHTHTHSLTAGEDATCTPNATVSEAEPLYYCRHFPFLSLSLLLSHTLNIAPPPPQPHSQSLAR